MDFREVGEQIVELGGDCLAFVRISRFREREGEGNGPGLGMKEPGVVITELMTPAGINGPPAHPNSIHPDAQ